MAATFLSKIILATTMIAFILYVIGFGTPYWLKKNFELNVPQTPTSPAVVVRVKSNIGLLQSCDDKTYYTTTGQKIKSEEDCGSDGAKDWQKVAGGFAIAALVLSFFSLVLCGLLVILAKLHGCKKVRVSVVVLNVITVVLVLSSLILYVKNKKIQVNPPFPSEYDFDLNWAYFITVASAAMYVLLVLANILDVVWNPSKSNVDITKEQSVSYISN